MPVATTLQPVVEVYHSAVELPPAVWEAFRHNQTVSNIMYPNALASATSSHPDPNSLWMTCSTYRSTQGSPSLALDFIISCSSGPLGTLPLFITATAPFDHLTSSYLTPRIESIVRSLLDHVPLERVFSVFAPEPVTEMFAYLWSKYTQIGFYEEPYYAAKFTYCTRKTFVDRRMTLFADIKYIPRLAVESDLEAVASLCKEFASTSEPFTLTDSGARLDAQYMIQNRCIWVLEAQVAGRRPAISSIVASCRQSTDVAAITKVFTNPLWRKRGCAERLVRWVCKQLLKTKETVVLYVAHDNPAAAGVYHRVGFAGLKGHERVDGVEPWSEIGFDRQVVNVGHW